MASWKAPKTNWLPSDGITNEDLNRIEDNEQYLYDETLKNSTASTTTTNRYFKVSNINGKRPISLDLAPSLDGESRFLTSSITSEAAAVGNVPGTNAKRFDRVGVTRIVDGGSDTNLFIENNLVRGSILYGTYSSGTNSADMYETLQRDEAIIRSSVGHRWHLFIPIRVEGNSTYTLKGYNDTNAFNIDKPRVVIQEYDENFKKSVSNDSGWKDFFTSSGHTFTTNSSTRYIQMTFGTSSSMSISPEIFERTLNGQVCLVKNSTAPSTYTKGRTLVGRYKFGALLASIPVRHGSDAGSNTYILKDTIRNGVYTSNIRRIQLGSHNKDWAVEGTSGNSTIMYRFYNFASIFGVRIGTPTNTDCFDLNTNFVRAGNIFSTDTEGIYISKSGHLYIRIKKSTAGDVNALLSYFDSVQAYIDVQRETPDIQQLPTHVEVMNNDIVTIVSSAAISVNIPSVQSTSEQLNYLHDAVAKNARSTSWLRSTLNRIGINYKTGLLGFIQLPNYMGGLIIQWGNTAISENYSSTSAIELDQRYHVAYKYNPYFVTSGSYSNNNAWSDLSTNAVIRDTEKFKMTIRNISGGKLDSSGRFYWFSFGR